MSENLYRVLSVGGSLEPKKYRKRRETLDVHNFSDMIDKVVQDEGFRDYQDKYSDKLKYDEEMPAQWGDSPEKIQPYLPLNTDDFIIAEANLNRVLNYHSEDSLDSLDEREHAGFYGYRISFIPLDAVNVVAPPTREQEVSSNLKEVKVKSPNIQEEEWSELEYSDQTDLILEILN